VKRPPGRLWLFFYGRQRRGVPWLLVVLAVAIVVLALTFAIPGAADTWRAAVPFIFGGLIVLALLAAVIAALRPRRRR
jgi:biotin transporter BioY